MHINTNPIPRTITVKECTNNSYCNCYLSVQQFTLSSLDPQCCLDGLDLHGDSRKHCFFETVELIKASPGAALDQTNEYPAHRLDINAFITVEN